jgi:hypothetical protein
VSIPKTAVAGDFWSWDWVKAGYQPSDNLDKTEMIVFIGTENLVASGVSNPLTNGWGFSFPATDTAKCQAALYQWNILAWKTGNRFTAESGTIGVTANPEGTGILGPQGLVALTLAEAKQTRFRLLSSETVQATFQGHTYTLRNLDELQRIIDALERELADEEAEMAGKKKSRIIFHRFVKNPPA